MTNKLSNYKCLGKIVLLPVIILFFNACNLDTSIPASKATGTIDEIVVIMEEQDWKGNLGDTVRAYFTQSYDLLPQFEPVFDVRYLKPEGFTSLLTAARNVIIFDVVKNDKTTRLAVDLFGKENINLKENIIGKRNHFASGQQILYVYGSTHDALITYINENSHSLVAKVADNEIPKLKNTIYLGGEDKTLSAEVNEKLKIELKVPKGYQIAKADNNLVWLRYDTEKYTTNLIIQRFENADNNNDFGVTSRNKFGQDYVSGNTPGSYMTTEDIIDYFQTEKKVNGKDVIESRGLWKMTKDFLGGPFLNYYVKDEVNNQTLVLDAFVMAPTGKKRQLMRQMEVLMNSIEI